MPTWTRPARGLGKIIAATPDASDDFVIEFQGRVIGKAGFWRVPEVGYILHPDSWGQGFAAEALRAVIVRACARFPSRRSPPTSIPGTPPP